MPGMRMMSCSGAILVLNSVFVSGQSPCPNVFDYMSDGNGVYGLITVRPTASVSTLQIRVNFTIATRLIGDTKSCSKCPTLLFHFNKVKRPTVAQLVEASIPTSISNHSLYWLLPISNSASVSEISSSCHIKKIQKEKVGAKRI
ncbi:hypothetical protein NE865_16591 [Phthorimaea operculella]|nr:hypothetical protein NE865_16591 [Phthorimaea operculella]